MPYWYWFSLFAEQNTKAKLSQFPSLKTQWVLPKTHMMRTLKLSWDLYYDLIWTFQFVLSLLQVKHTEIKTVSFHAHPLFQAYQGSQVCNSYVCSSLLSLSIMRDRKQMWKNNAKLLTVWATLGQQWDYWAVLKSFCSNQPSVKMWTMGLMNCNINRERGCQSRLFVLHRSRKKGFFKHFMKLQNLKKPNKSYFTLISRQGSLIMSVQ